MRIIHQILIMEYVYNKPEGVRQPSFFNTNRKWNCCIYDTTTLDLFEISVEGIADLPFARI